MPHMSSMHNGTRRKQTGFKYPPRSRSECISIEELSLPEGSHRPLRSYVQDTAKSVFNFHGKVKGLLNKITIQGIEAQCSLCRLVPGDCSS